MPPTKRCKVRVGTRDYPYYGVAATNISELKQKFARSAKVDESKLGNLRHEEDKVIIGDDGYFQSLNEDAKYYFEQTPSDALREGICRFRETIDRSGIDVHAAPTGDQSKLTKICNALREGIRRFRETINRSRIDVHSGPTGDQSLIKKLEGIDKRLSEELMIFDVRQLEDSRDEHPEWFEGLPENKKSKIQVMRERAKQRIQNYFYEAKKEIKNLGITPSKEKKLLEMTEMWRKRLKADEWFSSYFDRSALSGKQSFCSASWGEMDCEGAWNCDRCRFYHCTNPYISYDSRIRFQTWNFDHRIEKTRTVLPRLCELITRHENMWDEMKDDWAETFYKLWFTRDNLKLVDVACHDKSEHDIDVDITDPRNVRFDKWVPKKWR